MALGRQVQPVALPAFARHRRPDVAHAEAVGDADAPRLLDLGADGGEPGARLARGDDVAQAERGGVEPRLAGAGREVGGEGERAEERGDAEPRDQLEQPPRLADTDRHDRRPARLDRHVVGDAAGVERVVQAVRDRVVGAQAGDPERLAADARVRLVVGLGKPDRHGLAGRAGGHVQPHQVLARRAQVPTERRAVLLALAQLLLGGERDRGELAGAADARPVERRGRLEVLELLGERAHTATVLRRLFRPLGGSPRRARTSRHCARRAARRRRAPRPPPRGR